MITVIYKYVLWALMLSATPGHAPKKYYISTAAGLHALPLLPGDTILLKDGTWTDQQLELKAQGTEKLPIVMMAASAGKVKLTGHSILSIQGTWLVVNGLSFTEGDPGNKPVIDFGEASSWCRLTNTAVVSYNPPDKTVTTQFVSMHGAHNRVDHCYFKNKTNHGPTLVVWLSEKPNYHSIDHNHFGPREPLGVNGGETIRIGTSTWSLYDSYTTVEYNLFEHCDGELEIVSNKSCHNTLQYNTFFESQGTLTLRHGNDAKVYGNVFIGNQLKNTGGIRIIGERHVVSNNHFQGLKGTGVSAAISIMDGVKDSPLVGYYQVKHAKVLNNTMIDCEEAFSLGTGRNENRNLPPQQCVIAANQVLNAKKLVTVIDSLADAEMKDNVLYSGALTVKPEGFKVVDEKYFPDSLKRLYKKGTGSIPLPEGDVGPGWMK